MRYLAVYGTLRKGFSNHALLANARCVGLGWTTADYRLYADGIPYLTRTDHEPIAVRVELYEVDDATLGPIDALEEYYPDRPEDSFYLRETVEIALDSGARVTASIYIIRSEAVQPTWRIIRSGDYAAP